jgi:hypothetical protein
VQLPQTKKKLNIMRFSKNEERIFSLLWHRYWCEIAFVRGKEGKNKLKNRYKLPRVGLMRGKIKLRTKKQNKTRNLAE